MKRIKAFLLTAITITIVLLILFGVVVWAPEPWQDDPWTAWELAAGWAVRILAWPLGLVAAWLEPTEWRVVPDFLVAPVFVALFAVSGAFWAAILQMLWKLKKKKSQNQLLDHISKGSNTSI